jgi:hypothetical protein
MAMGAQPAFLRLVAGDFNGQGFGLLGRGGVAEELRGVDPEHGRRMGLGEDGAIERRQLACARQAEHSASRHVHARQPGRVRQGRLAVGVGLGIALGGKPQAELLIGKDGADKRQEGHQRGADAAVVAQPEPGAAGGGQHRQPSQQRGQAGQRGRHQHIEITARKRYRNHGGNYAPNRARISAPGASLHKR